MRRYLTLTGRLGTGAALTPGTPMLAIYDHPAAGMIAAPDERAVTPVTVLGCTVDAEFADSVRLEEQLPSGCPPYDELPTAVVPVAPDSDRILEPAVTAVARDLLMTLPQLPANAAFDLLTRRPPRRRDRTGEWPGPAGALPAVSGGDFVSAITAAVATLDSSYLAVQGAPGTGKVDTLARVLDRLITRHKWRIGVVARDHVVVERIFDALVEAGMLPELIAKPQVVSVAPEWSAIEPERYRRFLDTAVNGCVIGGTRIDFADPHRVPPGVLDLLVIADAGSCPVAEAIAVSPAARNLLLSGDPVPGPGRATHPEPVDLPVLSWLCGDRGTLPVEYGYFLDRTPRLHPRVCAPVSAAYYDGRLQAGSRVPLARNLDGVDPGVVTVPVPHNGDAVESDAEAREVVRQVRALLGRTWTDGGPARRLHPHDIFVVAPYTAQVARIRTRLARAKIEDVLVGTPDRFYGREAAVVVFSMTSSTPADAPHGMRMLLSREMIHAGVCRAMWLAVIIRSPLLLEYLPTGPDALRDLAALLSLQERG